MTRQRVHQHAKILILRLHCPKKIIQPYKMEEVEVLRAKLEIAELKNQLLEAETKMHTLHEVIDRQSTIIKENTLLLRKQRLPPRPYMNSTTKLLISQSQHWKCANPNGDCVLYKLGDGTFGRDLFEIDHIKPYSQSGMHSGNLRSLCSYCHAVVTRQQIADGASDDEDEM